MTRDLTREVTREVGGFIAPGATLGVMGGGQLGRMFVHAAQRMGYRTTVLDPDPQSPAGLVSHVHIQADYLDPAAGTFSNSVVIAAHSRASCASAAGSR